MEARYGAAVRHLPLALMYARLVLGLVLLALAWLGVAHFAALAGGLITAGLLTDIFDGIVARQLGVSTEKLRRLDSTIDQVFWTSVVVSKCLIKRVKLELICLYWEKSWLRYCRN